MKLKKEHLENLIDLAMCLSMQTNDPVDHSVAGIKAMGVKQLTFDAFDTRKIDEYASQAKASWGTTPAYKEYEKRSKGRTKEDDRKIHQGMIDIFAEFGQIRHTDPASEEAQAMAKKLQDYITEPAAVTLQRTSIRSAARVLRCLHRRRSRSTVNKQPGR